MLHPRKLLDSLGIAARKRWGQNFLTSPHWVEKLAHAVLDIRGVDEIWEIGPGLGALTITLAQKAEVQLRAFEVDPQLVIYLRKELPSVDVIEGDFTKYDLGPLLPAGRRVVVLSNLPYYVSSVILFQLLEIRPHIVAMFLTFQREFGERILAKPSTPDYGALSVLVQSYFEVKPLGTLSAGCFYPKPEVDSQAVEFIPSGELPITFKKFQSLVKTAFQHRRKKLISNLHSMASKEQLREVFTELGFDEKVRAEVLSPEDYLKLALRICAS